MRTMLIARLAAASAAIAGLAACGGVPSPGAQHGTRPASAASGPATVTPAPSTATPAPSIRPTSVPPGRLSPRPSTTGPGSPGISGWLARKDWTYIPTTRPVVALTFDADALPQVISGLRAQGYSFVTLDALTG